MHTSTLRVKLSFKYDKPLRLKSGEVWYDGYNIDGTPTNEAAYHSEPVQMDLHFLCSDVRMEGGTLCFYNVHETTVGPGSSTPILKVLYEAEKACAPKQGPRAVLDWWDDSDGNLITSIDPADVIALEVDQALEARNELDRLRDKITFLSQQLEDAEALWKQALEQRDELQKQYTEERRKCLRIASERNKLRRESDNAVEFDDRR